MRKLGRVQQTGVYCAALLLSFCSLLAAQAPAPAITLAVDAREAPRGILHARLTIPVHPGPLTLLYPKWIPGEHGPTGPIENMAGLKLTAAGNELPWQRDPLDMYAFHCQIPNGAAAVNVALDFLIPQEGPGFTSAASATPELDVLSWNQLLLYPQGSEADTLTVSASLELPPGWRFGTALVTERKTGEGVEFQPVSLSTLVDSPVIAGAHFRSEAIHAGDGPPREIDFVSDTEGALKSSQEFTDGIGHLVEEAQALFGSNHYRSYHFLVTLSDHVGHFGLEHAESSDDRVEADALSTPASRSALGNLLAHEYVHSWNGKYRRPAGMVTEDLNQPEQTDLLWVYEGLTEYLGMVLSTRSGLWTPDGFRGELAEIAARMEHTPGRTWRSLEDTAVSAQILYDAGTAWTSWRRGTDFYDEAALVWLEVDARLRQKTKGRVSLDDFCQRFYGGHSGGTMVVPYTLKDIVALLSELAPEDWNSFFAERLNGTSLPPPVGGIEASGWQLMYSDRSGSVDDDATDAQWLDLRDSAGLLVREEGKIADVVPGEPAAQAGLAPGMKLVAVNGKKYSALLLRQAIRSAETSSEPIRLMVEDRGFYETYALDYHDGEKSPYLQRKDSGADLLDEIVRSRAND